MNANEQPVLGPDVVTEGLGAFDELEFLGRGEFGETYRAVRGDDEYALKVIHRQDVPEHLWEREIAALERVDHPNVVGFRTAGRLGARGDTYPYLECEYIAGGAVKRKIDDGIRPSASDETRALLTGLLAGVAEIHDLGILHRDIKPANVALREEDWGQPVLLDFGLARVIDMSSHTSNRAPSGIRNRALLAVTWRSGLRIGEVLALRPKDIDLDAGTLVVQRGKGNRRRIGGVDAGTGALLARWIEVRGRRGINGRAPTFCTLDGGEIDQSYIRHLLPRLARKAGIEKRVHAHALRHAYAVELEREGAPLSTIRDLLGHSSLAATDVYLRRLGAGEAVDFARLRTWEGV